MFKAFRKRIGIIGFGNMGAAIAQRIKNNYRVSVFDKDKEKTKNLIGIKVTDSIAELVKCSDVLILAVKPQDLNEVLNELKGNITDRLIISIAAGKSTKFIEEKLGAVKVVRAMPNLPARIGRGVSCLCKGGFATDRDLFSARGLFKSLGKAFILNNDEMIDIATANYGSYPGYLYYLNEDKSVKDIKNNRVLYTKELMVSSKQTGLPDLVAISASLATVDGSIAFLEKTHLSPREAKNQVASRGGTTEAGIEVLSKGGSLTDAVKAALRRAQELSK